LFIHLTEIAEKAYTRTKPDGYDEISTTTTASCSVANRIVSWKDDQFITIYPYLLYTWHLVPASHFFKAGEYTESFLRVPKWLILEKAFSKLVDQWTHG
jgi:hypothetical protein